MKYKRIISAVFALAICFGGVAVTKSVGHEITAPVVASAEEYPEAEWICNGETSDGYCYDIYGIVIRSEDDWYDIVSTTYQYAQITGYNGKSSALRIPNTIEGVPVTSIGGFAENSNIISVTVPETVTRIDSWAFSRCDSLVSVKLPDSVVDVGEGAFSYCGAISRFQLPKNINTISRKLFYDCVSLTSVTIPDSVKVIEPGAFAYCSSLPSIVIPEGVTGINGGWEWGPLGAFTECSALTKVTLPSSLTYIGTNTFYDCKSLISIDIPENVETIDASAFYGCDKIKKFDLPDSVKVIGDDCFAECYSVSEINVPPTVEVIGNAAFSRCYSLTSFTFPTSTDYIANSLFSGSGLKSIVIPDNVRSIGECAFASCEALVDVTIPDTVETIGREAFKWCSRIDKIKLPYGLMTVEGSLFEDCSGLTDVFIPDTVVIIEGRAFAGCSSLPKIVIPEGVVAIKGGWESGAFMYCTNLIDVSLPESLVVIGDETFSGCSSLTSIELPEIATIPDRLFCGCENLRDFVIPESVKTINNYAFCDCSSYNYVKIPENVVSIGGDAFSSYWLNAVYVYNPNCAIELDYYTFGENAVIYGYEGSTAEEYANLFGRTFRDISTVKFAEIVSQPEAGSYLMGDTVSLSVKAIGDGISYQWYYKDKGQTEFSASRAACAKSPTFTYELTNARDGRTMYCEVSDMHGNVIKTVEVSPVTLAAPAFTLQPESVSAVEGTKVTFKAEASADADITYQWQYSMDNGKTWNNSTKGDPNTPVLSVDAAKSRNGYQYRCLALIGEKVYGISDVATLTVSEDAKITSQPANVTVTEGKTAKFTVGATGSNVTYQWQYSMDGGKTWSNCSKGNPTTATLSVDAVAYRSGYMYRCIVKSGSKTITSDTAKLTVKDDFKIVSQPENKTVSVGATVKFNVKAAGSDLTYQWQYSMDNGKTWKNSTMGDPNTDTLSVQATVGRNGYMYRCIVKSGSKTITSNAVKLTANKTITVTSLPSDVKVAKAGDIATVEIGAVGDGVEYQWYYKNPKDQSFAASTAADAKSAKFSFEVTSARNGRQMYCVVTDKYGNLFQSNTVTISIA